jgi:hypothetical protein
VVDEALPDRAEVLVGLVVAYAHGDRVDEGSTAPLAHPCFLWILGLSEGPVPRYRGLSGHSAALRTYSHDVYAFFGTRELATLSHALIGETAVRT